MGDESCFSCRGRDVLDVPESRYVSTLELASTRWHRSCSGFRLRNSRLLCLIGAGAATDNLNRRLRSGRRLARGPVG